VEKGVYAWDGSLLSNTPLRNQRTFANESELNAGASFWSF
jgi:hypothetical protein